MHKYKLMITVVYFSGADHNKMPGAVLGKVLRNLDSEIGVVEVAITFQRCVDTEL